MCIKTIEVTNDKAFHGKYKINVKAKLKDYKTEDFWAEVSPNILPAPKQPSRHIEVLSSMPLVTTTLKGTKLSQNWQVPAKQSPISRRN